MTRCRNANLTVAKAKCHSWRAGARAKRNCRSNLPKTVTSHNYNESAEFSDEKGFGTFLVW